MIHNLLFYLLGVLILATEGTSKVIVVGNCTDGGIAVPGSVSVTPHTDYSSSVGVLGCKINTNRAAYWPHCVDCDNICVNVTYPTTGRSVTLLRIDTSGGAYDISFDAYSYLVKGHGAAGDPEAYGGELPMTWVNVPMSDPACQQLIHEPSKKLAFMGTETTVLNKCPKNTWVGENAIFYNIRNPSCTLGYDEVCEPPAPGLTQATCRHQLGAQPPLSLAVTNIHDDGSLVKAPQ